MQRKSGIVDLCSLLMIEMLTKGAAPWGTRFFDNRFPFFFVVVNETRSKPCNRWGNDWIHPRGFTLISAVSERVPRRRTGECRSSISLSLSPSPDRSFLPSLLLRRGRYLLGSWAAPRSGHRTSDWRRRRFAKKNPARIGSHNRP